MLHNTHRSWLHGAETEVEVAANFCGTEKVEFYLVKICKIVQGTERKLNPITMGHYIEVIYPGNGLPN